MAGSLAPWAARVALPRGSGATWTRSASRIRSEGVIFLLLALPFVLGALAAIVIIRVALALVVLAFKLALGIAWLIAPARR